MMNDEDIKDFHDLDQLKQYNPLPSGLTVADSGISGQGLFTTRRLVMGTLLGISHYCIDEEYIRTPLGGFINHSNTPNCEKIELHADDQESFRKKWNLITRQNIKKGEEITLRYTFYNI